MPRFGEIHKALSALDHIRDQQRQDLEETQKKITVAQKRILDILIDGKPHTLIPELENAGYWNQHPAIGALERKHLIEVFFWNGYYTEWRLVRTKQG